MIKFFGKSEKEQPAPTIAPDPAPKHRIVEAGKATRWKPGTSGNSRGQNAVQRRRKALANVLQAPPPAAEQLPGMVIGADHRPPAVIELEDIKSRIRAGHTESEIFQALDLTVQEWIAKKIKHPAIADLFIPQQMPSSKTLMEQEQRKKEIAQTFGERGDHRGERTRLQDKFTKPKQTERDKFLVMKNFMSRMGMQFTPGDY